MTLRDVIDTALKQNPDVLLARLDEQKVAETANIARDPFTPKVILGSGLAKTWGFPMSIEGSAPSIIQARWIQSLYNKPRSFEVAIARENVRGAAIGTAAQRDEAVYRAAAFYLDAEQLGRALDIAKQQQASFEKIAPAIAARVAEGREIPIEGRRANLNIAKARQQVAELETSLEQIEAALAVALGFGPDDRIRAVPREGLLEAPGTEEASIEAAYSNSKELKRLESAMQVRGLEMRSARSARLPQIDVVGQYALFSRFNNYEDFFQRFERHNGQLGVSIALPILPGGAPRARAAQSNIEIAKLETQFKVTRDRIALDTRKAFSDVRKADSARDVAKLDLEVSREQVSVLMAQYEEGRIPLRQLEESRTAETAKWLAYYDAQHTVERARLELLRLTGTLAAALR